MCRRERKPLHGSGRRPRSERLALVVAVLMVALLGAGCNDERDRAAPPLESALSDPPGTTLGDGFSVAEGTRLLGHTFPSVIAGYHNDEPIQDDGWVASLLVTGDLDDVLAAYRAQANAAGLPLRAIATNCGTEGSLTRCSAQGFGGTPDDPRSILLEADVGEIDGNPVSHLTLTYFDVEVTTDGTIFPPVPPDPASAPPLRARARPPTDWPAEPTGDGRFGTRLTDGERFRLEPGSEMVGPVHRKGYGFVSFVAVLAVDGDAEAVVDGFLDQFQQHVGGSVHEYVRPLDDGTARQFDAEGAGEAGNLQLRLLTSDEPVDWLWLAWGPA